MKLSCYAPICFALLLCFPMAAFGQGKEKVDRKEIELLLELNYNTKAIIAYLEDDKRELAINKIDLRFMQKRGIPTDLYTWLSDHLPKDETKATLDDVIAHWQKHQDESKLLRLVKKSGLSKTLSVQETLSLTRAGVPKAVILAIREGTPQPVKAAPESRQLRLDDIVLMASNGKSDPDIVAAIKASKGEFQIDAAKILELKSEGLSVVVLRELYQRRKKDKETTKTKSVSEKADVEDEEKSEAPTLELFTDKGVGISMLKPRRFVTTKEFQSTKALIQMVAPIAEGSGALPELELSVMVVHPRNKAKMSSAESDLMPVAESFASGLRNQFKKDGIDMVTEAPMSTWIANCRALRIATQAQVKETGAGYQGASYLLKDKGRFIVISYSMRLENAHTWRTVLEDCVQSIVIEDDNQNKRKVIEGATQREQANNLFEFWRKSIRRLDFQTYQAIHYGLPDTIEARRAFLNLARGINEAGNRVEINGVDFDKNLINYNVFSVDGMSTFQLGFAKDGKGWILTTRRNP